MIFNVNSNVKSTGLKYPLDSTKLLFSRNYSTIDQIKSNIRYFLNLKQNDIPFEFNKYCIIHNYHYENINENGLITIQNELRNQLNLFFSILTNINVRINYISNILTVYVTATYYQTDFEISENIPI